MSTDEGAATRPLPPEARAVAAPPLGYAPVFVRRPTRRPPVAPQVPIGRGARVAVTSLLVTIFWGAVTFVLVAEPDTPVDEEDPADILEETAEPVSNEEFVIAWCRSVGDAELPISFAEYDEAYAYLDELSYESEPDPAELETAREHVLGLLGFDLALAEAELAVFEANRLAEDVDDSLRETQLDASHEFIAQTEDNIALVEALDLSQSFALDELYAAAVEPYPYTPLDAAEQQLLDDLDFLIYGLDECDEALGADIDNVVIGYSD